MITVMSCCYISMSCHVMSWHVGMGGFWLGHLAISDAGTFSRRHRWVFVGPCHLCVHGPPAFPFDSGFLTHTHTGPRGAAHRFTKASIKQKKIILLLPKRLTISLTMSIQHARTPLVGHGLRSDARNSN